MTPGTLGFVATLFVVVMVILLIRDMAKRIRRVRYTAEVDQARAQREAGAAPGTQGDGASPDAPADIRRQDAQGPDDVARPMPGGKHGPDNR